VHVHGHAYGSKERLLLNEALQLDAAAQGTNRARATPDAHA